MSITIICPTCGTKNHAEETARGTEMECAFCFAKIHVPASDHEAPVEIPGFQILESIGSGSNGHVYKALQLSMSREIALKVIPRANMRRPEDVKRFMNEVRLLARMDYSGIVAAYEAGETEDYYYLAMTYIDGESLDQRLERVGYLPEKEALELIISLAKALAYAWNKHQLLHRDIKPGNIMVDQHGQTKLMDLGISKTIGGNHQSSVTAAGMVVGTPYYMSPEQAVSTNGMDCRSDIYSLGATLYETVTGTKPFDGESPLEVMGHHRFTALDSPRSRNRKVSVHCSNLIESMMAKSTTDRHQSWQEVIADMERVLAGKAPNRLPPGKRKDQSAGADTKPRIAPIPAKVGKAGKPGKPKKANAQARTSAPAQPPAEEPSNLMMILSLMILALGVALGVGFLLLKNKPAEPTIVKAPTTPSHQPTNPTNNTPTPTTNTPTKPPPATRQWQRDFQAAQTFRQENPKRLWQAAGKFQELADSAPNDALRAKAVAIIEELKTAYQKSTSKIMRDLDKQAANHVASQDWSQAIAVYKNYTGPMAKETTRTRTKAANRLLITQAQQVLHTQNAHADLQDIVGKTAALIVAKRLPDAITLVDNASQQPHLAKLPQTAQLTQRLAGLAAADQLIIASLTADIDQEISLGVGTDTIQAIVKQIDGTRIDLQVIERQGTAVARLKRTITYSELSPAERAKRLGTTATPHTILAKGILAMEAGASDSAEKAFAQVDGMLADALLGILRSAKSDQADQAARKAISLLERGLGVEVEPAPTTERILRIWDASPSATVAQKVADGLSRYRLIYGNTTYAEQHRAIEAALTRKATYISSLRDLPLADLDIRQAIQLLTEANTGLKSGNVLLKPYGDGLSLDVSGSKEVTDLSPLLALPLMELNASKTQVVDLTPLHNTPMTTLNLSQTPIIEISVLRGLPLDTVDLSYTKIVDLRPLAGSPVRELNLEGCTGLIDFTPLLSCTRLEKLCIPNAAALTTLSSLPNLREAGLTWNNMSEVTAPADTPVDAPPEENQPPPGQNTHNQPQGESKTPAELDALRHSLAATLETLKLANPKQNEWLVSMSVTDTDVILDLTGCDKLDNIAAIGISPVTRLILDKTDVTDLSVLRNSQVRHLSLAETKVKEIHPLFTIPLLSLNLSGTPATDLGALKNLPLQHLDISNTPVKDFTFLRDMTELISLNMANTNFKEPELIVSESLAFLDLSGTKVVNLDTINRLPVSTLYLNDTRVRDLTFVRKLKLVELRLFGCDRISDWSPLVRAWKLERLSLPKDAKETAILLENRKIQFIETAARPTWTQTTDAYFNSLR